MQYLFEYPLLSSMFLKESYNSWSVPYCPSQLHFIHWLCPFNSIYSANDCHFFVPEVSISIRFLIHAQNELFRIRYKQIISIHHSPYRKKQCEHSVIIHVQLSGSLFLLHISFLCSVWFSGHRDIDSVCQALGLLLHWCLLATFTWTAIEGFHLYLLLVRVFNIYIKKYLLKLSLVGWGEFKCTSFVSTLAILFLNYSSRGPYIVENVAKIVKFQS